MTSLKSIPKFFVLVVTGIVAIIVGSFMIRGTMHLWDKPKSNEKEQGQNNDDHDV